MKCIVLALFLCTTPLFAQNDDAAPPVEISIGTLRTEAEHAAVRFAAEYTRNLEEIFLTTVKPGTGTSGSGTLLALTPEVSILTGDDDAFNGIVAKYTGHYIRFRTTTPPGGVLTPDPNRLFHAFPVSVGFETGRTFETVNAIVEAGYVPFKLSGKQWKLGLNPAIGIFLQAGYKSTLNADADPKEGGAVDESKETPNDALGRIKLRARFDQPIGLVSDSALRVLLDANLWFDILNQTTYNKIDGTLRLVLAKDRNFDLKFEHGSGPPNFNEGDQISANLTIMF
jgi:hypothetical protein